MQGHRFIVAVQRRVQQLLQYGQHRQHRQRAQHGRWRACPAALGLACVACAAQQQPQLPARATPAADHAPPTQSTRTPPFANNYGDFAPKGVGDLLRWRWDQLRAGLPKPPATPTPVVAPDLAFIAANARAGTAMQPAVTWIGHASTLLQMGGLNILADPVFSERASPFSWLGPKRAQAPGLALAQLPRVDVVVVSHNHYDHCDVPSLQALNTQAGGPPLFIVPLELKAWLAGIGIHNAIELDWWQSHTLGAVEIVLTPVQHWSARGLGDRMDTLWGGYAIFAPDFQAFFAGDTGYSPDFADIHKRFAPRQTYGGGFDLALIPVGAYAPRWFMRQQHVNADEAVRIHRELQAVRSVGVHWGTFELTDESLDEPPRALAAALQAQGVAAGSFGVLAIGQTLKLPRRQAAP